MTRHARQIQLPEVGKEGQAALRAAHVLVVGAGGLGVPVLQYLAGAGVGHITLVDPDRVEMSNLHRQPIYGRYLGQAKVMAASAFALDLDPSLKITPVFASLSPANAPDLIRAADVVLDCADSFAASYLMSDLCLEQGRPFISASALGLSGYVGGFCGGAPSLRALFPDLPDSLATCASAGVLGPVVGMLGTIQAQMALGVLLGLDPSPLGQLIRFEMTGYRFASFRFDKAPEPAEKGHGFLHKADLRRDDLVVELRGMEEAPIPISKMACRLSVEEVSPETLRPEPGQRVVFACRSGLRAWRAADRIRPHISNEIYLIADNVTY